MLTLQQIKEDPERIIARLAVKGFDGKQGVNDVIDFDDERRSLQYQNDTLAAELKKYADSIGRLMKEGRRDEADEAKKKVAEIKATQKEVADRLAVTENAIRDILLGMPNIPCDAVPEGKSAEDNVVEPAVRCPNFLPMRSLTGNLPRITISSTSISESRSQAPASRCISARAPVCSALSSSSSLTVPAMPDILKSSRPTW